MRSARSAAQQELLGLGILAALLDRPDDEDLWDEVMGEVTGVTGQAPGVS